MLKPMAKNKLQVIRERLHLTQTQMAGRLHKSQSAYAKLESGKTSLKKEDIILLLQEFGEDAADILEEYGITINTNSIRVKPLYNFPDNAMEKTITGKNGEIAYLKSIIETLLGKENRQ